jgi:nucleoside-diphosphate-sugar epimerase
MRKLKIGITGAGGFIGSHVVESLATEPVELVLMSGPQGNVKNYPEAMTADIGDFDRLKLCLQGVDVVVHLAGLNSVRDSFDSPAETLKVNTIGTATLLDVCKELGIKKVMIISSAEVYGRPSSDRVSENDRLEPLSPYGVSKAAIEQLCFVYHIAYGIGFKILRPFSVYGPGMSSKSLIKQIYNQVKQQKDVVLFNCGSVRDYCFVEDLARAIKKGACADFTGFEIYNVASGAGTSSGQLARLMQSIMKASGEISESSSPDRPRNADINHLVANIEKAGAALNWNPETSLPDGLQKTIHFFAHE